MHRALTWPGQAASRLSVTLDHLARPLVTDRFGPRMSHEIHAQSRELGLARLDGLSVKAGSPLGGDAVAAGECPA